MPSAEAPILEIDTHDIQPWMGATMAGIRDAALACNVIIPGLPDQADKMPTHGEVVIIAEMARSAVRTGRAIDFGHIPNIVIVDGGIRGGSLYDQGAFPQPFEAPWLFVHTWDHGGHRMLCAYLVNPLRDQHSADAGCEVVELQPAVLGRFRVLVIGDRALLYPPRGEPLAPGKYAAEIVPHAYRLMPDFADILNDGKSPEAAAAGNVLDPLMSALMLLNTDGVPRTTITPSEKLNKARVKSGKPPIPPHEVVDSRLYVTVISDRKEGRTGTHGGHHASPTPHIRRGHFRTLASGTRSFIRETLVRATPEARESFLSRRSHYEVRA